MTIAPIVTSAVALLAPYFAKAGEGAAKKAGEETWEKMKILYQVICNKLSVDKDHDMIATSSSCFSIASHATPTPFSACTIRPISAAFAA